MSEPPPKKQRLNAPTAVHKPFKSPFNRANFRPASDSSPPPSTPDRVRVNWDDSPSISTLPSSPLPAVVDRSPLKLCEAPNAEITALQRKQTELINRSRAVRSELDTVKQAINIEEADRDVELEKLVGTWRSVSQNAAEEIFATVKDRVNRMGGVYAWKKKEQEKKERLEEWAREGENEANNDDDEDEDEDENEDDEKLAALSTDERARRDEMRDAARDAKAAAREARQAAKEELAEQREAQQAEKVVEEVAEDEGFTMDMMLKELKVDLELIGFDAVYQKWID